MKTLRILGFLLLMTAPARGEYLYKALFVRAAPGKLASLIELYKQRMPVYDAAGDHRPFWMRHSQGDQWDLMLLFPMDSFSRHHAPEREQRRRETAREAGLPQPEFARLFYEHTAWHEDLYVQGPPLDAVRQAFDGARFFHLEIFLALPGKRDELRRQREMENAYLKALGRPRNLIFTHAQGAAWDLFTVGFYRDLPHFAESASIPAEKEEKAAQDAGFDGAGGIGLYLRTLIAEHHDTLAVAIP